MDESEIRITSVSSAATLFANNVQQDISIVMQIRMLVNLFALLNCVIIKSNLFIKFFAFRKLFIRHCSPWSEQTSYTTFIIILIKRNFISCKFQQTKMSNHLNYYGKFGNWFQNNYKSYNKEQEIQDSTKNQATGIFRGFRLSKKNIHKNCNSQLLLYSQAFP